MNKIILNTLKSNKNLFNKNIVFNKRTIFTLSNQLKGRYNSSVNNNNNNNNNSYEESIIKQHQQQNERMRMQQQQQQQTKGDLIFNQDIKKEQNQKKDKEDTSIIKPLIYDVSMENFDQVTMKSKPPVILNCYSNSGDLSKLSNEALEAYANQYPGCFVFAKLDVDKNIELAGFLKIQSLPTMFVIYNGEVLQQYVGLPKVESLNLLIEKVIEISGGLVEGKTIEQNQSLAEQYIKNNQDEKALEILNKLPNQEKSPQGFRTILGLLQCYTNLNNEEMFNQTLQQIKEKYPNELDHRKIAICKRILDLKKQVSSAVQQYKDKPVNDFELKIKENPNDLDSRYDVSLLYYQNGQYEKSINHLLEIIKSNKKYNRSHNSEMNEKSQDSAKNLLIKIFDSLDSQDQLIIKSRQKLNNLWFS